MAELEESVEDLYEGVMTELGDPTPAELKETLVWQKLYDSINHYALKVGAKKNNLLLSKAKININQGISDYELSDIQNYSRGLFADVIPITNSSERITIPIVDATTQTLSNAPNSSSGAFVIWKNTDGMLMLKVYPTPNRSYSANLWYKTTRMDIAFFDSKPKALEQFFPLIRKMAALSSLPHLKISDREKRDIRDGLLNELSVGNVVFEDYLSSSDDTAGVKRPASQIFFNNDDGY